MSAPIAWHLVLAAILLCLGALGLRRSSRRAGEVLLHSSILALVAASRLLDDLTGQRLALLAMVIVASLYPAFRDRRSTPRAPVEEGHPEGDPS